VRVAHVEAGLHLFNRQMPKEINRVLADHVSDLLFCPGQTAVDNLAAEGITHGVHLVGDVMTVGIDDCAADAVAERPDGEQRCGDDTVTGMVRAGSGSKRCRQL